MWGEPLTGFADAADPAFADLRRIVRTDHQLPCDVLPGAQTVLSYYVPIQPEISKTNIGGKTASAEWAAAYTETNFPVNRTRISLMWALLPRDGQQQSPQRHTSSTHSPYTGSEPCTGDPLLHR